MPEKLPNGWIKTTLGDIAEPTRERALPAEIPDIPYVGLEHVEAQTMRLLGHETARGVRSSSVRFSKGDVLYGKMRPYLNKVWVAEFDGLCSAEFLVFPKRDLLNNQFLALRLNAKDFVFFANGHVSGERPRVDFDKLSRFPIFLPPLAEQERIVAKLHTAWSLTERAELTARRAHRRINDYRVAVLHAAVTGELTRAWRETQDENEEVTLETAEMLLHRILTARRTHWEETELKRLRSAGKDPKDETWKSRYPEPTLPHTENLPDLPPSWIWASLDQLGELNRGKSKHRPRNDARLYDGPYPFIQTGDIRKSGGTIREHTQTYSEFGLKQSRLWPTGTLCITIAANIAETGILSYPACFPDSVVGFVQDANILNVRFVEFFIRSEKSELERYAPATAQKNINLKILAGLAVPLPPFVEQSVIVREVERRLLAADRLLATLDRQTDRANNTRQSLLSDAFIGRLVPQNPKDEPASVLLRRIRAAREAEYQKPKARGMEKIKSETRATAHKNLLLILEENGPMTPEQLFQSSGHSQESVDEFFAELRELTTTPAKILEERKTGAKIILKVAP